MQYKRITFIASAVGLFLSLFGLFLPWGQEQWLPGVLEFRRNYLLGVELLLGTIALIGCIVATVFLALHTGRCQKRSAILAMVGGLITLLCTLTWILNTDISWHWASPPGGGITPFFMWGGGFSYVVLYGAYITLFGSVLTSFMRVFNFFVSIYARDSPK